MKECTKCKLPKHESWFYPDKYKKSGLSCICIICNRKRVLKYKRTKKGLIYTIYSTQKSTSKKRGYPPPIYTKQELKEWMLSQKIFHELYNNWKESGYEKDLIPSCDRSNDYDHYSLDILIICTWKHNNEKHYKDVISGKNTKHCTGIFGIGIYTGQRLEYHSISKAAFNLGINRYGISNCLRGKTNQSGGYKWKYKD